MDRICYFLVFQGYHYLENNPAAAWFVLFFFLLPNDVSRNEASPLVTGHKRRGADGHAERMEGRKKDEKFIS